MKILSISPSTDMEIFANIEELLIVESQLKTINDGFSKLSIDTPEWVVEKMSEVALEINSRIKGELLRRLKAAKARRSALRTADEKRNDLDFEIKDLEDRLK